MRRTTLIAALLALASCGGRTVDANQASYTYVDGVTGGMDITLDGVKLEMDSKRLVFHMDRRTEGAETISDVRTLGGHPFGLEDGVFFIGPERYGEVEQGDTVHVTDDGVFVGEELRGPIPDPLPED